MWIWYSTEVQGMGGDNIGLVERHEDIFGVALLRVNPLYGSPTVRYVDATCNVILLF